MAWASSLGAVMDYTSEIQQLGHTTENVLHLAENVG